MIDADELRTAYFYAYDGKGKKYYLTEYIGEGIGHIITPEEGLIYACRVGTSTYIATNGKTYSNSKEKIELYNKEEYKAEAFMKMASLGLM